MNVVAYIFISVAAVIVAIIFIAVALLLYLTRYQAPANSGSGSGFTGDVQTPKKINSAPSPAQSKNPAQQLRENGALNKSMFDFNARFPRQ